MALLRWNVDVLSLEAERRFGSPHCCRFSIIIVIEDFSRHACIRFELLRWIRSWCHWWEMGWVVVHGSNVLEGLRVLRWLMLHRGIVPRLGIVWVLYRSIMLRLSIRCLSNISILHFNTALLCVIRWGLKCWLELSFTTYSIYIGLRQDSASDVGEVFH